MKEAAFDLVFCCDAGKTILPTFLESALRWMDDEQVAAVHHSRFLQSAPHTMLERWRNRHLLHISDRPMLHMHSALATGAALLRKSVALNVGNYSSSLRYGEDTDLGDRLLSAGYSVVIDPELTITDRKNCSFWQLMERYWRWHSTEKPKHLNSYLKVIWHSIKVMMIEDIRSGEFSNIPISLFTPHYRFCHSWLEELNKEKPLDQKRVFEDQENSMRFLK